MRLADLICKLCKKTYTVSAGCDVCRPAKEALEAIVDKAGNELESTANQALRLIHANLDRLEREMFDSGVHAKGRGVFNEDHVRQAALLTRATATILTEVRKLEERAQGQVAKMGIKERSDLIVHFIESLPPGHRHALVRRLYYFLIDAKAIDATTKGALFATDDEETPGDSLPEPEGQE